MNLILNSVLKFTNVILIQLASILQVLKETAPHILIQSSSCPYTWLSSPPPPNQAPRTPPRSLSHRTGTGCESSPPPHSRCLRRISRSPTSSPSKAARASSRPPYAPSSPFPETSCAAQAVGSHGARHYHEILLSPQMLSRGNSPASCTWTPPRIVSPCSAGPSGERDQPA